MPIVAVLVNVERNFLSNLFYFVQRHFLLNLSVLDGVINRNIHQKILILRVVLNELSITVSVFFLYPVLESQPLAVFEEGQLKDLPKDHGVNEEF